MFCFFDEINASLIQNLAEVDFEQHEPCLSAAIKSNLFKKALIELENSAVNHSFTSVEEEIAYYKQVKPRIEAEAIFYGKQEIILANFPIGSYSIKRAYLKKQLHKLFLFFSSHSQMFNYVRRGLTANDHIYFVRQSLNNDFISCYGA